MLSMRLIIVAAGVLLILDIAEVKAEDSTEEITEEEAEPLPERVNKWSKTFFVQAQKEFAAVIDEVEFFKLFGDEFREEIKTKLTEVNKNIDLIFSGKATNWIQLLMDSINSVTTIFFAGPDCRRILECSTTSVAYREGMGRLMEAIVEAFEPHALKYEIRASCEYFDSAGEIVWQAPDEGLYDCLQDALLILEEATEA